MTGAARPGDRHEVRPLSLRLPPELRAWAEREAAAAGKPLRRFLLDVLNERRFVGRGLGA